MLETIEKYRDLTETEKQNSIKKYIELSDDEKAFLEINIQDADSEYLTQKYFDFQQDVDTYKEEQNKHYGKRK